MAFDAAERNGRFGRIQCQRGKVKRAAAEARERDEHSEKVKESARGNWDPREVQQPFRSNPNGFGDRTTTLRRLLTGAVILIVILLSLSLFPIPGVKYQC